MSNHFKDIKVEKLPDSEALVTGIIPAAYLNECRKEAIKELNAKANLDGFRSGHIPEEVLVKKIGEMAVLEEASEIAIGREYANILKEADLYPIGRPEVSVTKLAPGIDLEFRMKVYLEPVFDLPDYKKIAKEVLDEKEEVGVSDKEVDEVMAELDKREVKPELPEGEDLKSKVKENLLEEKKFRAKEKKRLSLFEKLVAATAISIPKVLVDAELMKMLAQFKDDVASAGLKWEDYLVSIKKTETEIKEEWKEKAISRVKADMIIAKIAETEKLEPSAEELEKETEHLLSHYKDADPLRARIYVYQMMRNEKVIDFLENQN